MRIIRSSYFLFFVLMVLFGSLPSFGQVGVSITIGPPALPVYSQPLCPGEGYIWTPGYWAYDDSYNDYYWVPGTWVLAPQVGYLWTPPYWGWGGNGFLFHQGYWGPQVGFYGGIVYGYGYNGRGYEGGRWDGRQFYYNRSVNNINVTNIHNVYNTTVINNTTVNRVSYNGGNGGVSARPTAAEEAAARETHVPPVAAQNEHFQAARSDPGLRASANHGKPPVAATAKPGALRGPEVVAAQEAGAPYHPPANRAANEPDAQTPAPHPTNAPPTRAENTPASNPTNVPPTRAENTPAPHPENNVPRPPAPTHAKDLPPHERPTPPNTGNPKTDQKYQQQQEKLNSKQQQEHQKLAQQQEHQHQSMAQQQANEARNHQTEQKHQQQTQQMEQKHAQQQQQLNAKQQPPPSHNESRPVASGEAPHPPSEKQH